ncbi:MAG TPA: 3-methyl-2-oxobutanoate hydroxymethyltransferase, partial [Arcobacter sp.]|nr:3-methyl-2-oxobutanoate hydroxymethyltransferase [Arcobacter sp.]
GNYPKFVRQYLDGTSLVKNAVQQYKNDVESGAFPGEAEKY